MPIFQNALAMSSSLFLSSPKPSGHTPSSNSSASSPPFEDRGKFSNRKKSACVAAKGDVTCDDMARTPPIFGSSRQREKRSRMASQAGTPSSTSSISTSYFPSPATFSSYTTSSTPSISQTPGKSSPRTPTSRIVSPSTRKPMFSLKNLSVVNLVGGRQSCGREAGLIGLGVSGLSEEQGRIEGSERQQDTGRDEVVHTPAPMISPRTDSLPSAVACQAVRLSRRTSRGEEPSTLSDDESDEDEEDFVSYRHSYIHDFPLPPPCPSPPSRSFAAPEPKPAGLRTRYEVSPLPNTLQELVALKEETAQMYSALLGSGATASTMDLTRPGQTPARRIGRKAVPVLPNMTSEEAHVQSGPAKPFYNQYRATQSVMVVSSSKPITPTFHLPLPIAIPSRKDSLSPLLPSPPALPSAGILRANSPKILDLSSRRNSFSSASSSPTSHGALTPALTAYSGASTKSISTCSEGGSSPSPSPSPSQTDFELASMSPDTSGLFGTGPVFRLQVAPVEDEGGLPFAGVSPAYRPAGKELKKKQSLWGKAKKVFKA